MRNHYRQMTRKKLTKRFEENYLVLTAFGEVYFHYGKQGHRASKCTQRSEGDSDIKLKRNKTYNWKKRKFG
jgi:hypothetical protein